MDTKWDPLVAKYQRQSQRELAQVADLRRFLSENEQSREKVSERQSDLRGQLTTNNGCKISEWRIIKSFLADLDDLKNNCDGQIMELKYAIDRTIEANSRTTALVQKYEHLQKQAVDALRSSQERAETESLDEWATQSFARANLARELHNSSH